MENNQDNFIDKLQLDTWKNKQEQKQTFYRD